MECRGFGYHLHLKGLEPRVDGLGTRSPQPKALNA